jgi:hypothetical protein
MSQSAHGFKEGQAVWAEDGDGRMHQGEVVPIFRITPRDE